jgi:hypothetical protein
VIVNEEEATSFVDSNLDMTSFINDGTPSLFPAETKAVFWLHLIVLAVLVASAISVALEIYFYTSNSWIEAEGNLSRERSYICLVQANLHDRKIYEVLSASSKAVLVIFGPKQIVEEDSYIRYR